MPVSQEDYFTVGAQHPAMQLLLDDAAKRDTNAKLLVTDALASWVAAHGAGHLLDRTERRKWRPMSPLAAGETATLYLQPVVRVAVATVCRRLGITITQAASCALAWRYGIAPGRYPNRRGEPLEVLECGMPGAEPVVVDLSPVPKQKPAKMPKPVVAAPRRWGDRRETPELLAFEAARREVEQTASGPGGFSALMRRTA